ncbi:MAG: hypothetical protein WC867_00095 [Candidatus Pacearchaeota archaeon]|jgi:succinate dehydrogenase/fumarate reductase cytochrome b subunit
MKFKKKSESALFKESRQTLIYSGIIIVLISLLSYFFADLTILFVCSVAIGFFLITAGFQRYFQQNPSIRDNIIIVISIIVITLLVLGVFIFIKNNFS